MRGRGRGEAAGQARARRATRQRRLGRGCGQGRRAGGAGALGATRRALAGGRCGRCRRTRAAQDGRGRDLKRKTGAARPARSAPALVRTRAARSQSTDQLIKAHWLGCAGPAPHRRPHAAPCGPMPASLLNSRRPASPRSCPNQLVLRTSSAPHGGLPPPSPPACFPPAALTAPSPAGNEHRPEWAQLRPCKQRCSAPPPGRGGGRGGACLQRSSQPHRQVVVGGSMRVLQRGRACLHGLYLQRKQRAAAGAGAVRKEDERKRGWRTTGRGCHRGWA